MQALQETLILKQRCDVEKRGLALASPRRQQSLVERVCKAAAARGDPGSPVIMCLFHIKYKQLWSRQLFSCQYTRPLESRIERY